jgi:hypothetical protein
MMNSTPGGRSDSQARKAPAAPIPAGDRLADRREAILSPADLQLRSLRYFLDLLDAGYRHALAPDPLTRSLRAERIALGIDLPELDTVPLWAMRRDDGSVSIPFIEFILGQIGQTVEALCSDPAYALTPEAEDLAGERRALGRVLERIVPAGDPVPSLPRLRDLFAPESLLEELCGTGGILERVARGAESLLKYRLADTGH